ncbi:hypothetical protein ACF09J_21120 [Streptomyces sp. NPDC014889]|uniref:hypothetical protein n=1 Tax=Streptomyces sp. NPDC014889 TaxID=3364928 RepID=UPI0036FA1319
MEKRVFGKYKDIDEPAAPVVPWADAWEFVVGDVERPPAGRRRRPVLGPRAFRVPQRRGEQCVNAPCAFFPQQPPSSQSLEPCLYEDADGRTLLCSVDEPVKAGGERRFAVRDGRGQAIGTIRRIAPLKHALTPVWRIDQPGHAEIVSSGEWAKGGPKEMFQRGAGKLVQGIFQGVADLGADGGDQASDASRVLRWTADGEPVLASDGRGRFLVRASWLDRRLVFAYVLVRDC